MRVNLIFLDPIFQDCLEEYYAAQEEFNFATISESQRKVDAAIHRIKATKEKLRARLKELKKQKE